MKLGSIANHKVIKLEETVAVEVKYLTEAIVDETIILKSGLIKVMFSTLSSFLKH